MWFTNGYLIINRKFEIFEKVLAVLLISYIVVVVFAGTVARYVFDDPMEGVDRQATYAMVWLGFIGFQIATSKLRHIEVEFLKARVSETAKYRMNIITCFIASIFLGIFTTYGLDYVKLSQTLGDLDLVLAVPMWTIIMIIPISFSISAVRYFCSAFLWIDVLKGRRKEEEFFQKKIM